MKRAVLAFCIALMAPVSGIAADNTIKINWINNPGSTITENSTYTYCQPATACTNPYSIPFTYPVNTAGVLKNVTTSTTFLRSIQARYRYLSGGVYKSCQVEATAFGPSSTFPGPGCEGRFNPTFIKGDGTGSSPTCTIVSSVVKYLTCDFEVTVRINN